jgi:hypothetical protein
VIVTTALRAITTEVEETELTLTRLDLVRLCRELEARQLDVLRIHRERCGVDDSLGLHSLELEDCILDLQVALELRDESALADVLQIDVHALAVLLDRVCELATAPCLDLDELASIAADDFDDAVLDFLRGVGVDIGTKDVDGLVLLRG